MTPKEKAQELIDSFDMRDDYPVNCGTYCSGGVPDYKRMAVVSALLFTKGVQEHTQMISTPYEGYKNAYEYFKIVKQELELELL
tara:strand:- start:8074 stop:8325 length:252 start_codon:yes stop_codon:yes gene_type:complete